MTDLHFLKPRRVASLSGVAWRVFILCLLLNACTQSPAPAVKPPPNVFVDTSDPGLKNLNGTWLLRGVKFNGYIIEKNGNELISRMPVTGGRENGVAFGWYPTGKRKYARGFLNGNREGIHRGWYESGRPSFIYFFHDDKYEGEQRSFFESGHRWQTLTYVHGYEEGKQKTWNDSGRVINNFTVKKGKLYGVIGRYDCMSVIKK